ncbi:Bromodomain-domain-containing protein [Sparassis crispa]|uniref:Bromodomain-domain-containing protein n=1 Tax=Sparassis crispa TaxID=139825 RepID=A0A401GBE7_9APHY|nr:Bromodomain-domain-containing protein [Sparassis crispa]GBE79471.1 Bromodomain-domain-containing protein [Sparassis crispa]
MEHPMISHPKGFFSPQLCQAIFLQLMEEAGLECPDATAVPRAPVLRKLAQRHYAVRLTELRELIAAEEVKFKALVSEIDGLRDGQPDSKSRPREAEVLEEVEHNQVEDSQPLAPQDEAPARESASAVTSEEHEVVMSIHSPVPSIPVTESSISCDVPKVESSPGGNASLPLAEPLTEAPSETEAKDMLTPPAGPAEGTMDTSADAGNETEAVPTTATKESLPETADEGTEPANVNDVGSSPEEHAVEESVPSPPAEPPLLVPTEVSTAEQPSRLTPLQEMTVVKNEVETQPVAESSASHTEGKRKASEVGNVLSESQREKKRAREDSEPFDDEDSGPSTRVRRRDRQVTAESHTTSKRFQNVIGMLHAQISQHRYGNIFHNPIKKSEAPDYHDIVKRPMDLKTIKSRIKDGLISTSLEFQRDVYLMFANAIMYNRPGSEIVNMTEEMMAASEININTFRQTEGFHRM